MRQDRATVRSALPVTLPCIPGLHFSHQQAQLPRVPLSAMAIALHGETGQRSEEGDNREDGPETAGVGSDLPASSGRDDVSEHLLQGADLGLPGSLTGRTHSQNGHVVNETRPGVHLVPENRQGRPAAKETVKNRCVVDGGEGGSAHPVSGEEVRKKRRKCPPRPDGKQLFISSFFGVKGKDSREVPLGRKDSCCQTSLLDKEHALAPQIRQAGPIKRSVQLQRQVKKTSLTVRGAGERLLCEGEKVETSEQSQPVSTDSPGLSIVSINGTRPIHPSSGLGDEVKRTRKNSYLSAALPVQVNKVSTAGHSAGSCSVPAKHEARAKTVGPVLEWSGVDSKTSSLSSDVSASSSSTSSSSSRIHLFSTASLPRCSMVSRGGNKENTAALGNGERPASLVVEAYEQRGPCEDRHHKIDSESTVERRRKVSAQCVENKPSFRASLPEGSGLETHTASALFPSRQKKRVSAGETGQGGECKKEGDVRRQTCGSRGGLHELPDDILHLIVDCCAAECLLVCRRLAETVRQRRRVIRVGPSVGADLNPAHLLYAVQRSPSLRILEIAGASSLPSRTFESLVNSRSSMFPQRVQVLVLRKCAKVPARLVRSLTARLRRLRAVDLQDNSALNHEGVAALRFLPYLERVALGVSAGARCSSSHSNRTLESLVGPSHAPSESSCPSLPASPSGLPPESPPPPSGAAGTPARSLSKASTEDGSTPVSKTTERDDNRTVHAPPLKVLSLARCTGISSVKPLVNVKDTLEFLDLRGCSALDDHGGAALASLKQLQVLVLAETGVTSTTVGAIAENCRNLEMLDVSRIGGLSKPVALSLSLYLTKLRRLKLSSNSAIDDECVRDCLVRLPSLALLDVSHCWRVSSACCTSPPLEPSQFPSGMALRRFGLYGCNVERQRVEDALIDAGASKLQLCLHHELPLFEIPGIYANMEGLDLSPPSLA